MAWGRRGGRPGAQALLTGLGYVVVAGHLALIWLIHRLRPRDSMRWSALLLFTATPFWIPTSWPHYFSYLPAVQPLALDEILAECASSVAALIDGGLLLGSIAAGSSLLMIGVLADWGRYSRSGSLFVSNLCVLILSYRRAAAIITNAGSIPR